MTQIPKTEKEKQDRRNLIFGSAPGEFNLDKAEKMKRAVKALDQKFEEEQVARKAKGWGANYFDLTNFPIDQTAITALSEAQARQAEVVPFFRDKNHLKLAMANPSNPLVEKVVQDLEKKHFVVDVYLVSHNGYDRAMQNYRIVKTVAPVQQQIKISDVAPEAMRRLKELQEIGPGIAKLSPTDLLTTLLSAATAMRASDIHIQPEKNNLAIRFRVDGVLQDTAKLDASVTHNLTSRIKILSKLKLNVTRTPQDGSFAVDSLGEHLELRVSILPSASGEAIVMRLLGTQTAVELEELGLRGLAFERIKQEIDKPNGMILTTGPTGSGKTTTLYSFLKRVNKPGVKIITLENPVEYRLEGIEQIQIDERGAGMTFAGALRSVLRQDPDIIMVGEIRDYDTADVAAQAALTGHMVYSTLHTNDAAGAIPRLLHLGVKPVTLAPALSVVIAQRLVRRLCQQCREEQALDASVTARVKNILSAIPAAAKPEIPKEMKFYHGRGCLECNYLGYKGRIGVFELFPVDDDIQQLVFKEASTVDIKNQAVKSGMVSMIQDGLLKSLEGLTDVAEVFRVTEE
ncbi:MAG: GspE/PulE family protein [Patescibacteria group bacterium]